MKHTKQSQNLNFIGITCFIVLLLLGNMTYGQIKRDTLRLFIIGNSFSQNATTYLDQIAKENGKILIIGRAEIGGCSLERHWSHTAAFETDSTDAKGKPYKGRSLKLLLSEQPWDIVTIQQNSYNSSDLQTYQPYARNLYNYVKKHHPAAKILLHQTWAYRVDAKKFGRVNATVDTKSDIEMWEKSRAAYHLVAKQLNVKLIPVGDAFNMVRASKKHQYKKDTSFDFEKPVYPNLPDQTNSLNLGYSWKNKEVFRFDGNHANDAGKYLGSLVWYAALFNASPREIKYTPTTVPVDFAAYLRIVAKKVSK